MSELKSRYQELWRTVERESVSDFLDWLDTTDFYTAPCSTKHHLAKKEGLVEHSLNVLESLRLQCTAVNINIPVESQIICGLGHDICKADFYGIEMRNVKENGVWVQKPVYVVDDKFPYGHGEKSVLLLNRFVKLKTAEHMAIRWHMGGFTSGAQDYGLAQAMTAAFKKYPLALLLHMADMHATYLMEYQSE